ncbi:MAG: 3-phosphoshikimate 1-carboxyvinyltransferase [Fibrobacteraceae bacterium]|nr:3-phosphoshikimate 1-carboxyvinyltransferase [Fibrobacteraceae bacterium]
MNFHTPSPTILIHPVSKFAGVIRLPGSKSISNRALLLAALAKGETRLHHLLLSDDTRYMGKALQQLGIGVRFSEDFSEVVISGTGSPFPAASAELFLGNSGTALRSLTAATTLGIGEFKLSGEERMTERPIRDLVDALIEAGASINYTSTLGYPPIQVHAHGLEGGTIHVKGNISSQYLTALLISAPYARTPIHISVEGELISRPYISMTLQMMEHFGIKAVNNDYREFSIPQGTYTTPGDYEIEGDASSATYALAGAAISGGPVKLLGLDAKSLQGDVRFTEVLKTMGAEVSFGKGFIECRQGCFPLKAIDLDLSDIPDAAMTVAALALFADGTSTIRGIKSWRVKETDRIAALTAELRKTGANVTSDLDSITITPPEKFQPATFETYNDHRMAMCMSLTSLAHVQIKILDSKCVQKTYPNYWKDFESLSGSCIEYPPRE